MPLCMLLSGHSERSGKLWQIVCQVSAIHGPTRAPQPLTLSIHSPLVCTLAVSAGRTADAVRNRWHRLQKRSTIGGTPSGEALDHLVLCSSSWCPEASEAGTAAPSAAAAYAAVRSRTLESLVGAGSSVVVVTGSDHGRSKWSAEEDETILEGVRRLGCRWREIAALLPGRSDSSIRNRWHRMLVRGQVTEEAAAMAAAQTSLAKFAGKSSSPPKGGGGGPPLAAQPPRLAKEPSLTKQPSLTRQPSLSRQPSLTKQSSLTRSRSVLPSDPAVHAQSTGPPGNAASAFLLPPLVASASSPPLAPPLAASPLADFPAHVPDRSENGFGLMALALVASSQSLKDGEDSACFVDEYNMEDSASGNGGGGDDALDGAEQGSGDDMSAVGCDGDGADEDTPNGVGGDEGDGSSAQLLPLGSAGAAHLSAAVEVWAGMRMHSEDHQLTVSLVTEAPGFSAADHACGVSDEGPY